MLMLFHCFSLWGMEHPPPPINLYKNPTGVLLVCSLRFNMVPWGSIWWSMPVILVTLETGRGLQVESSMDIL